MTPLRRHLNYANVVATLALVFAMSGGALAASHYLINSTKQIKPSVLKKLKGSKGARGAPGTKGLTGATGATGATGTVNTSNFFTKTEGDGRYLGAGAQALDSAKLGGIPAAEYTTGQGAQGGRWQALTNNEEEANFLFVPPDRRDQRQMLTGRSEDHDDQTDPARRRRRLLHLGQLPRKSCEQGRNRTPAERR